ncbi:MAG TPA: ubiquitin-conjugating enzyme E2 [Anaerolineales bacterium]|jgi:ubiquitin-protein ligase|nr:ubiquitin-conjugating enzyme E2 [Anaerolineales bacterium]
MPDLNVTIVLPSGGARTAEVPDDVAVQELMSEFTSLLELPTTGPDGRPMTYRLDSKALGRVLKEEETLSAAGVPENDRLMLTADITAGGAGNIVGESPRMRRLRADQKLMQELAAQSNLISFVAQSPRPNLPPERYIVTFKCKSIANVDRQGNPQYSEHHQVEIYLHNQYPQRWPGMKWLTPIWHPNINHLNGSVCIDAAWWTASRSLDRLVVMLGEMLQYKNYHDDPTKPPFPWDPEAARWSREYRKKHPNIFPVDKRELLHAERVKFNAGASSPAAKKPAPKITLTKSPAPAAKPSSPAKSKIHLKK